MHQSELIAKTKAEVDKIKRVYGKSRGRNYPAHVKKAIIELSSNMTGAAIAKATGISGSCVSQTILKAKNSKALKSQNPPIKKNIVSDEALDALHFIDISDQFSSSVKDEKHTPSGPELSMRFSTPGGIIVEIFS